MTQDEFLRAKLEHLNGRENRRTPVARAGTPTSLIRAGMRSIADETLAAHAEDAFARGDLDSVRADLFEAGLMKSDGTMLTDKFGTFLGPDKFENDCQPRSRNQSLAPRRRGDF